MTAQIVWQILPLCFGTEQGQFAHVPCAWERFQRIRRYFSAPQVLRRQFIWCGLQVTYFETYYLETAPNKWSS